MTHLKNLSWSDLEGMSESIEKYASEEKHTWRLEIFSNLIRCFLGMFFCTLGSTSPIRTPLSRNRIATSELILLRNAITGCFLTKPKFRAFGGNNPMASTSSCGAEIAIIVLTFLLRFASSRVLQKVDETPYPLTRKLMVLKCWI